MGCDFRGSGSRCIAGRDGGQEGGVVVPRPGCGVVAVRSLLGICLLGSWWRDGRREGYGW